MKKKIKKISAIVFSVVIIITMYSSISTEVYAASKIKSSSITSVVNKHPEDDFKSNKITFKWKKVKGVTGYEIEWDVSKKFNSNFEGEHCEYTIKANSKTGKKATKSFKIDNYDGFNKVYIRVRTYKKYYNKKWKMNMYKYSSWSKIKTVKLTTCTDQALKKFNDAYAQMNINASMSDFEKIVQIQKWIDANWYYDTNSIEFSCRCNGNKDYEYAHNLLEDKHSGCQSFARAFRYFANKAGIPCEVIHGISKNTGRPHFWNWVCVDGYWYDYDCENYGVAGDPFAYCDSKWAIMRAFDNYHGSYNLSEDSQQIVNSSNPKADDNMIRQRNKTINQVLYNRGL